MDKYNTLKKIFSDNQNKFNKTPMDKYMLNNFKFYGINSKDRKNLEKEIIKNEKQNKKIDWEFLNNCYNDEHREMQYFVLDYLEAMQKYIVYDNINYLEYFVKNKQWWDFVDRLDKIIGEINDDSINDLMLSWSTNKNMWYRRLAIDHQQRKKEKTNTELLEKIILNNLGSKEFFINKAIGWSLREYSKYNPLWVSNFIKNNKNNLSNLSIREASKFL